MRGGEEEKKNYKKKKEKVCLYWMSTLDCDLAPNVVIARAEIIGQLLARTHSQKQTRHEVT